MDGHGRSERREAYAISVMNGRVETKACGVMVKVEEQEAAI